MFFSSPKSDSSKEKNPRSNFELECWFYMEFIEDT